MRMERKSAFRRYWPVATLVVSGIGFGAWHNAQTRRERPDVVAGLVRGAVSPPASVLGGTARWFSGQAGWIFAGRGLSAQNARLARRVAELESENAQLREAAISCDRLRADLNFVRSLKRPPLAAEVWSLRPDPKYDTLIISRGRRDGIQPHDLVISPEGIVGYVSEVDPITATVVLLTDQNATLGARIQRANSRAVGLCRGSNGPLLTMTDLEHEADVKPGDLVVTSGLSRLYPKTLEGTPPRDLIIGEVVKVQPDASSAGKTALVRPKVDYERLEEVYVLR
jgi:rod shape-determining protein MreC